MAQTKLNGYPVSDGNFCNGGKKECGSPRGYYLTQWRDIVFRLKFIEVIVQETPTWPAEALTK
ncbi:hypothetical protein DaDZ19_48270 [Dickeya ananatis]